MHLVPQTLRYKIWLCSSLTKLKTSSIEYVLMILVGSYTQCVTGVLPPQKQLQSESLAKQFNTLSYIQLYQNARILEMIPAESQKIPTESLSKYSSEKRLISVMLIGLFIFKLVKCIYDR